MSRNRRYALSGCSRTNLLNTSPCEDYDLAIPSVTVPSRSGLKLLTHAGEIVHLSISTRRHPSYSGNILARLAGLRSERIVVCAHYDKKIDTPGAHDNAAGVAALLTLAEILAQKQLNCSLELVAFSGEEVYGSGDMEYARQVDDGFRTILATINMVWNSCLERYTAMNDLLSVEQIEDLRSIDTPTICNAVETFQVRGRMEGFLGMDIRCLLPELGTMVGYAIPVTVDSTTPEATFDPASWLKWMQAMEASPKPCVLVFKDVGPQPRKSAHFGEVMGTIARRLGVVGLVTDGGVRDILEIRRLGLHYFAAGLVPSHGNPRLLEINVPVDIDGVLIRSGDLIHGDINGVAVIPGEIATQVGEAAQKVREEEADLMSYVNGPEFSVEGLYKRKFSH